MSKLREILKKQASNIAYHLGRGIGKPHIGEQHLLQAEQEIKDWLRGEVEGMKKDRVEMKPCGDFMDDWEYAGIAGYNTALTDLQKKLGVKKT